MIRWIIVALLVLVVLLVVVVLVAGRRSPLRHVARVVLDSKHRPEEIWAIVSDIGAWPSWNTSIEKMERLPDRDGHPVWSLKWRGDVMPSEVLEMTPPSRLVTRIADDSLPFGGTWTWEIVPRGDGAQVSITEDGVIKNAFFRGVSSLFLGYVGTQSTYLGALAKRLGEEARPVAESVTFPPLS